MKQEGEDTMNTFGYSEKAWSEAKGQARKTLIQYAKKQDDICYSDLVTHIHAIGFEPHDTRLFHLLGEISTDEHAAKRPLLSVLVIHKTGDRQPGPGFFQMAYELGFPTAEPLTFWITERQRVLDYWKQHRSIRRRRGRKRGICGVNRVPLELSPSLPRSLTAAGRKRRGR
jgi:hypothetical protein